MDKVSWIRLNCIGRGSFGTVSLAADKLDGGVFAVKSVEMNSSSVNQLEALENEISILKSISSQYIVEYISDDFTMEDGLFRNLHMEYLPWGTVSELSDVDERTVRSYTWCLTSALNYLHGRGIVHCDVKGRNVLVGPVYGSAKLADFGSAKEHFSNRADTRGSPLWMAPEVIRGDYQGPESDVWSLGCTVIEMITGKPGWKDNGVSTLVRIACSDELPEIPDELSETGRDFLDKCFRRNTAERWTCNQLLQHPFLSTCSPPFITTDFSPKCVLDRLDSNFSDEEELDYLNSDSNATERITELAGNSGSMANWESDGWIEVRGVNSLEPEITETDQEYSEYLHIRVNSSEPETTGTNTEYSEYLHRGVNSSEHETTRTNPEYSEYLDTDGCYRSSSEGSNCKYYCNNSCCYLNLNLLYTKDDYKCKINVTCAIFYLSDSTNTTFNLN